MAVADSLLSRGEGRDCRQAVKGRANEGMRDQMANEHRSENSSRTRRCAPPSPGGEGFSPACRLQTAHALIGPFEGLIHKAPGLTSCAVENVGGYLLDLAFLVHHVLADDGGRTC